MIPGFESRFAFIGNDSIAAAVPSIYKTQREKLPAPVVLYGV